MKTAEVAKSRVEIGLSIDQRQDVVQILSTLVADEFLLCTKTRNYHWNVVGPHFHDLHKFFESQYEELDNIIDDAAERVRQLGGRTVGTLKEYLSIARLEEGSGNQPDASRMIPNLLDDHETTIRHLRADLEACADKYRDAGTSDFLTGLLEKHEKMAWMLRACLE